MPPSGVKATGCAAGAEIMVARNAFAESGKAFSLVAVFVCASSAGLSVSDSSGAGAENAANDSPFTETMRAFAW